MITPQQNDVAMDELDELCWQGDLDFGPLSHYDLKHKAKALIVCDRMLTRFEQDNRDIASAQRRASIHLKLVNLWGTKKCN